VSNGFFFDRCVKEDRSSYSKYKKVLGSNQTMKAQQFSPSVVSSSPQTLEEKVKHKHKAPKESASVEPVYGVSDPNGHVIKRIRETNPRLWHKIQNLD
jgi:hypothetical protein